MSSIEKAFQPDNHSRTAQLLTVYEVHREAAGRAAYTDDDVRRLALAFTVFDIPSSGVVAALEDIAMPTAEVPVFAPINRPTPRERQAAA
jgi:hypothetical protein